MLEHRLTAKRYPNFLEDRQSELLEDAPFEVRLGAGMCDNAPAHFAKYGRQFLNYRLEGRWIGRGAPQTWPPRTPDMMPLDCYLLENMKSLVRETKSQTVAEVTLHF